MAKLWTPEEDAVLIEHYGNGIDLSIIGRKYLPKRGEDACRNRLRRLGLYRRKTDWKENEINYVIDNIYNDYKTIARGLPGKSGRVVKQKMIDVLLQRQELAPALLLFYLKEENGPVRFSRLVRLFPYHIGEMDIELHIDILIEKGYDVRIIHSQDSRVVLFKDIHLEKDYHLPMGNIKTPFAVISDLHISSKSFSHAAWEQFINDIHIYGIKYVLIAGDILQARGVYHTELDELVDVAIGDQIQRGVDLLRMIPKDVTVWMIAGNHEDKIKGNIHAGMDTLKMIAKQLPNVNYVGFMARLMVNDKYTWLMFHGEGAITDNPSRKLEKTFKSLLVGSDKPDGLVLGHFHVLLEIDHPKGRVIMAPGTFQKGTLFTERKGIPVEVGWKIVLGLTDEMRNVVTRFPRVV